MITWTGWLIRTSGVPGPATAMAHPNPTLEWAGETLDTAVPVMGDQIGRRLRAGSRVGARRLFLFSRTVGVEGVMQRLRVFVPFPPGTAFWLKSGDREVLEEDLKSTEERILAVQRWKLRAEAERRRGFADAVRWASEASEKEAGVRASARDYQSLVLDLPAARKDALFAGQRVVRRYTDFGPRGRQAIYSRVRGHGVSMDEPVRMSFRGSEDFARCVVEMAPRWTRGRPGIAMRIYYPDASGLFMGSSDVEDAAHPWDPAKDRQERDAYRERPRHPAQVEAVHVLQRRVTWEEKRGLRVEAALREFAARAEIPLIGEYDPCISGGPVAAPGLRAAPSLFRPNLRDVRLWEVMEAVAQRFDLDWDYRAGWIEVRSPRTLAALAGELDLSPLRPVTQEDLRLPATIGKRGNNRTDSSSDFAGLRDDRL